MDKAEMRERLRQVIERYAKSPNWTPRQEMKQPLFWKSIRSEFIGSFILMVFSTNSDLYIGPVSYGCMIVILTYSFKMTGAHQFNPVITLVAVLLRTITPFRCVSFILAQAIGTLSGATVVSIGGISGNANTTLSVVSPILTVSAVKGFGYEFFATLVIVLAMCSQLETPSQPDEPLFPLISGLAVGTASAFARPATGGFMNPIRAFSLALFQQDVNWYTHHIYWIGPILGSLIGVFTFDFIRPTRRLPGETANDSNGIVRRNISLITKDEEEITQQDTEFTLATLSM